MESPSIAYFKAWPRILVLSAIIGMAFAQPATAHDFWLQPSAFHAVQGQPVSVRLLIGDPEKVEHWETEWRKIVTFQDFGPSATVDLLATLVPLESAPLTIDRVDARVTLASPGTHLLAFASNHAVSDLPAEAFNAYAEHEGLALPLAKRQAEGRLSTNGRELYSRRAKALIQIGPLPTANVTVPIGQTLEIVPDTNPYALKPGEPLRVRIWLHGKPLAGASVVAECLEAGAKHGVAVLSDKDGYATFSIDGRVDWKVNVVWSYPITDPRADYETIFSSMTFGAMGNTGK